MPTPSQNVIPLVVDLRFPAAIHEVHMYVSHSASLIPLFSVNATIPEPKGRRSMFASMCEASWPSQLGSSPIRRSRKRRSGSC